MVPEPAPGARVSGRLGRGLGRRAAGARCPLGRILGPRPQGGVSPRCDATSTACPGSTRQHRVVAPPPLPIPSPRPASVWLRGLRIARCPHEPQGGQRQAGALPRSLGPGRGSGKRIAGGGCRQPGRGNPHTAPSQRRVLAPGPQLSPRASRWAHPRRAGPTVEMQI